MKSNLFEHLSYKRYLLSLEKLEGHGFRSRLARAIRCHLAYVSQVLNKAAQLSLEQAEDLNLFLEHTPEESEFFLLLVQLQRAGSEALRMRIKKQVQERIENRRQLRNRVDIRKSLSPSNQIEYYSSWHYAAIHIALTIPTLRGRDQLASHFGISTKRTQTILDFLVSAGLAQERAGEIAPGETRIFLKSDSPMVLKHHTNWRMKAIESLDQIDEQALHLSTVVSLSVEDIAWVKERLLQAIEEVRARIKNSPEEKLNCFNLDFFAL